MGKMTYKQQSEYLETLYEMWQKTARVCGYDSKPELAMFELLADKTESFYHEVWEDISDGSN